MNQTTEHERRDLQRTRAEAIALAVAGMLHQHCPPMPELVGVIHVALDATEEPGR